MRNVLFAVLLAASLPAMANISSYLQQGMPLAAAYQQASIDCGGNCDADLFAALQAAGISDDAIVQAALDAGADPQAVVDAATQVGMPNDSAAFQQAVAAVARQIQTLQPTAAGPDVVAPVPEFSFTPPTPTGGAGTNPVGISPVLPN